VVVAAFEAAPPVRSFPMRRGPWTARSFCQPMWTSLAARARSTAGLARQDRDGFSVRWPTYSSESPRTGPCGRHSSPLPSHGSGEGRRVFQRSGLRGACLVSSVSWGWGFNPLICGAFRYAEPFRFARVVFRWSSDRADLICSSGQNSDMLITSIGGAAVNGCVKRSAGCFR